MSAVKVHALLCLGGLALACSSKASDAGLVITPCDGGCPGNQLCYHASCVDDCAQAGGLLCGTTCVDATSDDQNCGKCGQACSGGRICVDGKCAASCPASSTLCIDDGGSTYCTSLTSDLQNCGACGNACAAGLACYDGGCTALDCPPEDAVCFLVGGGSRCSDLQTDPQSCGLCGFACSQWQTCVGGHCTDPTSCPTGLTLCTGSTGPATCADLTTDIDNCGRCGNSCGLRGVCTAGSCSCRAGFATCATDAGSVCADLSSDVANCGACGQACVACEACSVGVCDATGFFAPPQSVAYSPDGPTVPFYPYFLVIGDFNADGKNDLAVLGADDNAPNSLEILFGDGQGGFPTSVAYFAPGGAQFSAIASGDVNGDGLSDLFVSFVASYSPYESGFIVYATLADGGSSLLGPFTSDPSTSYRNTYAGIIDLAVADFNSDGIDDVAVSSEGYGVDVFYALADGGFNRVAGVYLESASDYALQIGAGDLNGDGRADLVVTSVSVFGVLLQTPYGGFGSFVSSTDNCSDCSAPAIGGQILVEGDFFGDGITSYQVDGTGALTSGTFYPIPAVQGVTAVRAVDVADLNQDGIPDVLATESQLMAVWLNHGLDAGLDQAYVSNQGGVPFSIAVGDLNGDGRPDVVLGSSGLTSQLNILLNQCPP